MSADNWAVCPRCKAQREEHLRSLDIDLANAYGTVPVEEFDRLRSERDEEVQKPPAITLREDYEIWGIEDGEFHVSYSGRCAACDFKHVFKHDMVLEVGASA